MESTYTRFSFFSALPVKTIPALELTEIKLPSTLHLGRKKKEAGPVSHSHVRRVRRASGKIISESTQGETFAAAVKIRNKASLP